MAVRENGLDGVMTLRPDPHRLKLGAALVPLPVAIILSLRMLRYGWLGVVFIVATLGGIVAVVLALHWLRLSHGFVRLTPTTVSVRHWYERLHSVPRAAIARVVLVTAALGKQPGDYDVDYLVFLDGDGRVVLHTNCVGIAPSDQRAFADALGVPVEALQNRLDREVMRRAYPGTVGWFFFHQTLVALVGVAALGTVISLVVFGAATR